MKSEDLIKEFEKAQIEADRVFEERQNKFSAEVERVTNENVKSWLGDLVSEFTLGKIIAKRQMGADISVSQTIIWRGLEGSINMRWSKKSSSYAIAKPYMHFELEMENYGASRDQARSFSEK